MKDRFSDAAWLSFSLTAVFAGALSINEDLKAGLGQEVVLVSYWRKTSELLFPLLATARSMSVNSNGNKNLVYKVLIEITPASNL